MDNRKLPKGFIEVEEAVELIKSNTFDKPTVDIKKLANSLDWIEVNHNFAIKKMRLITKEEYVNLSVSVSLLQLCALHMR